MFAKVFSQIFDSSIAEDYNCRRMFMDLLVLADSDGVVDMTPEAISRRTNVPMDEVVKYVKELCQPDAKSRSQLHDGKRLIPLDTNRDWGWIIVNYAHYRKVRDEEARREYFRSAMRKSRKKKKDSVKDNGLTDLTKVNNVQPPASASSSLSASDSKRKAKEISEVIQYASDVGVSRSDAVAFFDSMEAGGWTRGGKALKDWKAHLRSYKANGYLASQRQRKNGAHPDNQKPVDRSKIELPDRFKSWASINYEARRDEIMKWRTWADVPNSLRQEWWTAEKSKLPIEV